MARKNIKFARALRKNQTEAEKKLWALLRNRQLAGVKFRRQFSIDSYILDFYSPEYKLGIEADGGQHYEEERRKRDEVRGRILSKYGVRILRFSDFDILENPEGVYKTIENVIGEKNHPSPFPLPQKPGERS